MMIINYKLSFIILKTWVNILTKGTSIIQYWSLFYSLVVCTVNTIFILFFKSIFNSLFILILFVLFANLLSVSELRVRFVEHCNKNVSDNLNKVERMAGVCHLSTDYTYLNVIMVKMSWTYGTSSFQKIECSLPYWALSERKYVTTVHSKTRMGKMAICRWRGYSSRAIVCTTMVMTHL